MEPLVLCPACRRHVRRADDRCPFCRGRMPGLPGAAWLAAGAVALTASLSLANCGEVTGVYGSPGGYGGVGGVGGAGGGGAGGGGSGGGGGGVDGG